MRRPKTLTQVEAMEEKGSSSSSAGSRWNPTKEQIAILEGLYRQGIRTPTAEQIQHITGKLREFGTIEGKNVFYWFQNHKARQRQKQKQESFAYFTRLLHHQPPPPLTQACTNDLCNGLCLQSGFAVMYTPFCFPIPQVGAAGYYPTTFMPGAVKRRSPKPEPQRLETAKDTDPDTHKSMSSISLETLQLFPLHPTGILEERSESSLTSASAESESVEDKEQGSENLPFFNFFDGPKGSC